IPCLIWNSRSLRKCISVPIPRSRLPPEPATSWVAGCAPACRERCWRCGRGLSSQRSCASLPIACTSRQVRRHPGLRRFEPSIEDILRGLPSKDDLANAVGLQIKNSATQELISALGIFSSGILLGAGLALLFAPKAGAEIRRDIARKVEEFSERIGNGAQASD